MSKVPSRLSRARLVRACPFTSVNEPPITIFPSAWMATAWI